MCVIRWGLWKTNRLLKYGGLLMLKKAPCKKYSRVKTDGTEKFSVPSVFLEKEGRAFARALPRGNG